MGYDMTLAPIEAGISGSKGMELHRGRLSIAPERCIVGFSGCQFIVDGHFHFEDLRAADPDKAVQLLLNVNCVSKAVPTSYNVKSFAVIHYSLFLIFRMCTLISLTLET